MKKPKEMSYFVVQEGGTSEELYLHSFDQRRHAERYRVSAAGGAYRTSPVCMMKTSTLDALASIGDRELFDAAFSLVAAAQEVEYP